MQAIVDMICAGATEFTPQVVVGLLVFSLILDCIGSVAHSVLGSGLRR